MTVDSRLFFAVAQCPAKFGPGSEIRVDTEKQTWTIYVPGETRVPESTVFIGEGSNMADRLVIRTHTAQTFNVLRLLAVISGLNFEMVPQHDYGTHIIVFRAVAA